MLMVIQSFVLLLHFVRFLKDPLNMMPLQESDKVNNTLTGRANNEIFMNFMMDSESDIVNSRRDLQQKA